MKAIQRIGAGSLIVCWLIGLAAGGARAAETENRWARPAADLAGQVADLLGPGQAQLAMRNLSTIPANELAGIRKILELDLKARGVVTGGAESANRIRVTLSENGRERLWVAEVVEGNTTRVAMVHVDLVSPEGSLPASEHVVLRKEKIEAMNQIARDARADRPVLAAAEINGQLVVLFPDRISVVRAVGGQWIESGGFAIDRKLGRDPRAALVASADGRSFTAYVPGAECAGTYSLPLSGPNPASEWSFHCHASDDPWPVYQSPDASAAPSLRAFYNTARDYFTGVVTPGVGVDLPPFYSAGMIPRAAGGAALLLAGLDGKVEILENGSLQPIRATRDWGSDFAVVRSGCGTGTQVLASSSGEGTSDSLRAFAIPGEEALAESAPLSMDGAVTALWTAQDGKSAMAVVAGRTGRYEVDRVTALCN